MKIGTAPMQSRAPHEAPLGFAEPVDHERAGDPQQQAHHAVEAMVIVSEADRNDRPKIATPLADLFITTIGNDTFQEDIGERSWTTGKRPLGVDFTD